jgi:hypothetical protein
LNGGNKRKHAAERLLQLLIQRPEPARANRHDRAPGNLNISGAADPPPLPDQADPER